MSDKCGIYKITIHDKVYIGQSIGIAGRWQTHRYTLRKGIHRNTHLQHLYNKYPDEMQFEILEECPQDGVLLTQREQYWMDQYIDCRVNFGTAAESPRLGVKSTPEHKEKIRQSNIGQKRSPEVCKAISDRNKGRIITDEQREKLSQANQKPWTEKRKQASIDRAVIRASIVVDFKVCRICGLEKNISDFYPRDGGKFGVDNKCKECESERKKKYYQDNREKKLEQHKEYYQNNKEEICAKALLKSDEIREYKHKYGQREEVKAHRREKQNSRRNNDPLFRLKNNLRANLSKAIQNNAQSGKAIDMIGCSILDFKRHLESNFEPGMSWDNYGNKPGSWHLCHIVTLDNFNLFDESELFVAYNYSNIRPKWAQPSHKEF